MSSFVIIGVLVRRESTRDHPDSVRRILSSIHSPIMAGGGLCGEEGADAVVTTLRGPVLQKGPLPKGTPRLESFLSAHPTTRLTFIITSRIYTPNCIYTREVLRVRNYVTLYDTARV